VSNIALRFDKIEAHGKRNLGGRARIVAVLKDWQVICLAAGSMIMLGIMLYSDWPQ
jgi:hypothetical protein